MENAIIISILIIVIFIGLRSSVKHFKGQGGCCGGGSEVRIKPKKLKHVTAQVTVGIEGMTCEHCRNRVESRLNELDGVSARVDLKKKTAVISMEKEVSEERIRKVIENAGYQVASLKNVAD